MKIIKGQSEKPFQRDQSLTQSVLSIISNVRENGDKALIEYANKFDSIELKSLEVSSDEIKSAYAKIDASTIESIRFAASQIEAYAKNQMACFKNMEYQSQIEGIILGHRLIPIDSCGCYIPSGRYPLPSSALMGILTAKVAGVKNVVACSPPSKQHGGIHPAVLVAMDIAGADKIYAMGGAQAIAAYAYGTSSISKCDIIVGPGNKYVTEAKRMVLGDVGIDSLAGPSEVLVIADKSSNPHFIAIDMLAQCEHDPNARGIVLSTDEALLIEIEKEIECYLEKLPTAQTAYEAWKDNGQLILVDSIEEAIQMANQIAPEHLQVECADEDAVAIRLRNFGSLFIGAYAPVTFGDYCSGTNHILPTMATARYSSGVCISTFIKTAFYQKISEKGCKALAPHCMKLAALEGLAAHEMSVKVRCE